MDRNLAKWAEEGRKHLQRREMTTGEMKTLMDSVLDRETLFEAIATAFRAGAAVGYDVRKKEEREN